MTRIKICGITNLEDAVAAVQCGAHALGFVFAESPRRMTAEAVREILRRLPPFVTTVGVFVDEEAEAVREIARQCRLSALQFHGAESPDYCHQFDRPVIKGFRVRDDAIAGEMARYRVAGYLLDSAKGGGAGQPFSWDLARGLEGPIILAGGLTPDNVEEAVRLVRPYAVDVSSGVESCPGIKDREKMEAFVWHVRRCDR
jgi:phosphoribosylanthranilate isomerase